MEQMYRVHVNVDMFVTVRAETEQMAIMYANNVDLENMMYYNEYGELASFDDMDYSIEENRTKLCEIGE